MYNKFVNKIFTFTSLAITLSLPIFASNYSLEDQPNVMEQVMKIEQRGTLKQKKNGYLYIDISDDFIATALPLIEAKGKIVPSKYGHNKRSVGAHISVMNENERVLNEIWEIKEIGQEFEFTILEMRSIKVIKDGKMQKLWLLAVDAPEIEKLRVSYGLEPKIEGNDFHITLGKQIPSFSCIKKEKKQPKVALN